MGEGWHFRGWKRSWRITTPDLVHFDSARDLDAESSDTLRDMRTAFGLASVLLLAGCGTSPSTNDTGASDGGVDTVAIDADDSTTLDATLDASDAIDVADAASPDADGASDATDAPDAPAAMPLTAPDRTWTWFDIDTAVCDDGTPTGIGVNLAAGAPGTVVILNGGGLCFDAQTCLVLNTSTHGPFGASQFTAVSGAFADSILDRALAGNPFANWNMVFVPSCTSDAHTGDHVATYTTSGGTRMLYHRGRANIAAFLPRLAATVPASGAIAVLGLSTGGFGALANHDLVRASFPAARVTILDDAGPLFAGDAIPATMRDAWYANWGLSYLDATCPACRSDLSQLEVTLASRYPSDRVGLLSSLQDRVMRSYYLMSALTFETNLRALTASITSRSPRAVFISSGEGHVVSSSPASAMAVDGAPLLGWLGDAVNGTASWTSHGP